ncbi:MAG TPA: glycosyltransferase [Colwellia sp.]|nr:glycosyltransferase [Colwellia sp.]|tara:strand:- start:126 stop:881 length:756 start_codon:yes stop_codon:yes gene_type:complete
MKRRSSIITMDVNITNIKKTLQHVEVLCLNNIGAYICVSNVHMCMEVYGSPEFAKIVNEADLVIPDGKPLSWAQKLLSHSDAEQVRGQDIMNALCASSGEKSLNIGFYGGSSDALLDTVKEKLLASYPDINITYAFSPPFRPLSPEEDVEVVNAINAGGVDILFVGIGCPKQEIWMAEHKNKLNCVMLGVGAAYDFIAGEKKHAPRWVQKIGMEWFFRLCSEPKRLWRRYFSTNPKFIWHFSKQYFKELIK